MSDPLRLFDEPRPDRSRPGACRSCGAYRYDGEPPFIHFDGCADADPFSRSEILRWIEMYRRYVDPASR